MYVCMYVCTRWMGVITRLIEVYRASRANLLVRFCSTRQKAGTTGCGFAVAWPLGREDGLIAVCPRQRASQEEAESAARKSDEHRAKSNEKQTENHRKIDQNRGKIEKKSVLGELGRPKLLRGRAGTRSGPARDAQKPSPGRCWRRRGTPKAAKTRPKPGPSRPKECPGRLRRVVRAMFVRQALSNSLPDRFFTDFAWSREVPKS